MWEAMVDENRAMRAELDHRRHFTAEKETISLTRDVLNDWTIPRQAQEPELIAAKSASNMSSAADADLVEVG